MAEHIVLDIFPASPLSSSLPPAIRDPDQHNDDITLSPNKEKGEAEPDNPHSGSYTNPDDSTKGDGAVKAVAPRFVDCRICQEEDKTENLEIPCSCSGTLKYAHRICVQRWCNEKGDTICEICRQPYQNGYKVLARPEIADSNLMEPQFPSSRNWGLHPYQLQVQDPTVLTMWEAEYDEYPIENFRIAACCRSVALILMSLLLLRHVLGIVASGSEEDTSAFFVLYLLKAAGLLIPCYVIARAMNILQHRRHAQMTEVVEHEAASPVEAGEAQRMQFPSSSVPNSSE